MHTAINIVLACVFVFLAGFNVWNMLAGHGTPDRGRRWIQVHRAAGYAFIALFAIFSHFMFQRVKGSPDELPPRILLHVGLALLLAPLLFVKVMMARYQKASRDSLRTLGIAILMISFTLVALNLTAQFLRSASDEKVPSHISVIFIAAVLGFTGFAFFGKRAPHEPRPVGEVSSLDRIGSLRSTKPTEPLNLTLVRVDPQTHDAKTLRFVLPPGQQLGARPGQFLTFEWIIEGKPAMRSYSICSSPTQTGFIEITPKRTENGYVSHFLNDRAQPGLTVKARGPYGRFCFDPAAHKRIVLVAAGSGITPMMAILRYIDDLCLSVDCTLIYCVRKDDDIFFKSELNAFATRFRRFRAALVLSQAGSDWKGWKGRLRREILEHEIEKPLGAEFFLCGPPTFMEHSRTLLLSMSVDPAKILQESFGSHTIGNVGPVADQDLPQVHLARAAVICRLPAGKTLLETSEINGVLIPSGCRQGYCGTCATKLLSGNVRMEREEGLTDALRSQGFILPCVSRPLGDVTLDA